MLKSLSSKKYLPLGILIFLAVVARFLFLGEIPIGISHDELDYIINAKSLFLTGTDLSGAWDPFTLAPPPGIQARGVIPYFLIAPFVGRLPTGLFTARLPYALVGVLLVGVIYFIGETLFNKRVGFFSGLITIFNPWAFYMSRTAYEGQVALLLYLLGFLILIRSNGRKLLWSIPLFFLALYSYLGTNLIFLPVLFVFLFYAWKTSNPKNLHYLVVIGLVSILITGIFLISGSNKLDGRLNEIISLDNPIFSDQVKLIRQQSFQNPVEFIFVNKLTNLFSFAAIRWTGAFSPATLFTNGDPNILYSFYRHGLFYLADIGLLFIGICSLFAKYRKQFWLLLGVLVLAPIPALIRVNDVSYVFRASFILPALVLIAGLGSSLLFETVKKRRWLIAVFVAIYGLQIFSFLHYYFFQMPIATSEQRFFSSRILADFATRERAINSSPIFIVSNNPKLLLFQYLFYNDKISSKNIRSLQSLIHRDKYQIDGISFIRCEQASNLSENQTVISDYLLETCHTESSDRANIGVPRLSDNGAEFLIKNQKLCQKTQLIPFPPPLHIRDFTLKDLSQEDFCRKFLISI